MGLVSDSLGSLDVVGGLGLLVGSIIAFALCLANLILEVSKPVGSIATGTTQRLNLASDLGNLGVDDLNVAGSRPEGVEVILKPRLDACKVGDLCLSTRNLVVDEGELAGCLIVSSLSRLGIQLQVRAAGKRVAQG